jgi:hypothetical protein
MARGYSQSGSERSQSLLSVPGPEIAKKVREIIDGTQGSMPGTRFITAMNLYNEMSEDAKAGRQISLTALSVAGGEMERLKNTALSEGYNKPMSTLAESMRSRLDVNQNNVVLVNTPNTYLSNFDKSDPSNQTYDQRVIQETGKKLQFATDAMKILRNAPEAFATMKVADVETFVNDYVRMNLKGAAQAKFTGIKWNVRSYPD